MVSNLNRSATSSTLLAFYCWCCYKPEVKVIPTDLVKQCGICLEEGATKRICCNCLFCDYCYTKNRLCPNCKTPTRQEKMTGATFVVAAHSDHEECRVCLEPGLKRRCCGNYYCDECYYNLPQCRSCEAPVSNLGYKKALWGKTSVVAVILGWFFTIFVCMSLTGLVLTLSVSESLTPVGISGFKCYGLFRTCDIKVCIDMPEDVASGAIPMPPLTEWNYCDLNSVAKLQSHGCIFDDQLYGLTDTHRGYDVCYSEFTEGLYIFEDTFEYWTGPQYDSNLMVSGKWQTIVNGNVTDYCGAAFGKNALSFSGTFFRYANTKGLDVSSGGWLEAKVLLSPEGWDITRTNCKTSYGGGIDIEYSIDDGGTWIVLSHYDAWEYRSSTFFNVHLEIPEVAQTTETRFQFRQPHFDSSLDAWALDDVKVYRYLPPDWHSVAGFMSNVRSAWKEMQRLQCCFDTEWCIHRLSITDQLKCSRYEWYDKNYILRGSELYVCLCAFVTMIKWIYCATEQYFIRNRLPFQDEYEDITQIDWLMEYLPPRYRPMKNLSDYVGDIHKSARLVADLRNALDDQEEEEGGVRKREAIEKAEKKAKKKALKKEKKRLKKRMENKNYRGPGLESLEEGKEATEYVVGKSTVAVDEDSSDEGEDNPVEYADTKFGSEQLTSDMDKYKRMNVSMLRMPFDTVVSQWFRAFSTGVILFMFSGLLLYRISTTTYYVTSQPMTLFGSIPSSIVVTSFGVNFLAFLCDLRELYYVLKNVFCVRDAWVPLLTVDLSVDVNSLFVGDKVICIDDIKEHNSFTPSFIKGCAFCYFVGAFPWCLFSLTLRDQLMPYSISRFVSGSFAAVMCSRAILGPGFVLKAIFGLFYFLDLNVKTRASIGQALQTQKTKFSAYSTSGILAMTGLLLSLILLVQYSGHIFGICIVVGLVYGTCTGCMHELPIRPWMHITQVDMGGIWMRVKKKQRCPCLYWGAFLSDMHDADEVFVVFPEDDTKFSAVMAGKIQTGND